MTGGNARWVFFNDQESEIRFLRSIALAEDRSGLDHSECFESLSDGAKGS